MKLRYYLRGLGIGIVVTALIMGLSDRDARPLTDAEIKAKAASLGMVESESLKLTDVVITPDPIQKQEDNISGPAPEENTTPETEPAQEATATPETEPVQEATATPKPTATPEPTSTPEKTVSAAAEPTPEQVISSITIKSGSGSETVCRQLEEAGLIENAASFNQYLIDNGYSKKICVGTYEIRMGTTEEEIAKIITKSR